LFFPESVFGVLTPAPWRAFEHAGWVLFEVVFLIWGCLTAISELRTVAYTQAELEDAKSAVEQKVEERTGELLARTEQLEAEFVRSKNLETQLAHAQKMESIGQLAAGIAHEINTPMQFLSDNIEFLSDCSNRLFDVVDGYQRNLFSDGQQRSWAERRLELENLIERNQFESIRNEVPKAISESLEGIQRVIHIVRAMKEFSHPGHQEKVGVDLNNAVTSTVTISRNRWKYVADLEMDLDPDLPTLNCVPADINQVLLNLIVNAADAIAEKFGQESGNKGRIVVRTRSDGWSVVVEVEDNGMGIPDDIRRRIFDPFFTTKDVGKGTGQGLAICYNVVVRKHNGVIEVESTPGVGSVFRVTIPRRAIEQASAETAEEVEDAPVEMTIA
jgi:signal transduction histidine kinase